MNPDDALAIVLAALTDVAPEIDTAELDPDASLRDGAEMDSMDFQGFIAAVSDAIGADIPEGDYRHLDGVAKAAAYVAERG
jgi:acyl carrier protein